MSNYTCPKCHIIEISEVSSTETCIKCDSNIMWERDHGMFSDLAANLESKDKRIDELEIELRLLHVENRRLRNG